MPSTSYFFPKAKQGTALGLQAGIGNFGVSLVQFVTPWIVGLSIVGASQRFIDVKKGVDKEVWYQNAGYIWVPFIIVGVILAWTLLRSVPVQARGVKDQMDIFSNKHTWLMTVLYVITFGTFSGLAAQFGLLIKNLFGADAFGAAGLDAAKYVFWGAARSDPLRGSSPARSPTASAGRRSPSWPPWASPQPRPTPRRRCPRTPPTSSPPSSGA